MVQIRQPFRPDLLLDVKWPYNPVQKMVDLTERVDHLERFYSPVVKHGTLDELLKDDHLQYAPTISTTNRAPLYSSTPFNVKALGAVGNGANDDTNIILSAAALAAGKELYFPAGTYRITRNCTIAVNVRFETGALIAPDSGVIVTLTYVDALPVKIFSGVGTVMVTKNSFVWAQWWGADNTRASASDAAFQAAINTKLPVTFLTGSYSIKNSLTWSQVQNQKFVGCQPNGATDITTFYWDGAASGTVFHMDKTRDSYWGQFAIKPGTGSINIGFWADQSTNTGAITTNNVMEDVHIDSATTSISITGTDDNDSWEFHRLKSTGAGTQHVLINNVNAKVEGFHHCIFTGKSYGWYVSAGSFNAYDCGTDQDSSGQLGTVVYVGSSNDPINFYGLNIENTNRLIQTGSAGTKMDVNFYGGRHDTNAVAIDGLWATYQFEGCLRLDGIGMVGTYGSPAYFSVSGPTAAAILITKGCTFNQQQVLHTANSEKCIWYSEGDQYVSDSGGHTSPLTSGVFYTPSATVQKYSLAGVVGFSSTNVSSNNRGGTTIISAGSSSAAITFTTAETDANYVVSALTFAPNVGSPGTDALRGWWSARTTTGFTITLASAPAAGTSVLVVWTIDRY